MRKYSLEGGQMEKNLPSHQIDRSNLSSARRRPGLPALGGATALPAEQPGRLRGTRPCRLLLPRAETQEQDGQHKSNPKLHVTDGRGKGMAGGSNPRSRSGTEQPQGLPMDMIHMDLIAALAPSLCYCCSVAASHHFC